MNYFWSKIQPNPNGSVAVVDVQGLSHPNAADAEALHAAYPQKPIAATECCSCLNQRDEDADQQLPVNSTVTYRSNSAPCQTGQTAVSDTRPWMAGQYIWTAHDYIGGKCGYHTPIALTARSTSKAHTLILQLLTTNWPPLHRNRAPRMASRQLRLWAG